MAVKGKKKLKSYDLITFVAGCGREQRAPDDVAELAYTVLEFPECRACQHRVSPESASDFCVWRPDDAPHPFASLALWQEL